MGAARRAVICHYHIFKNSGSSFEELLRSNYGEQFIRFDGPFRFSKISPDELLKVALNSGAKALSCHQINLPVPTSLDVTFLPVVFVRHPLLRLRSIYQFSLESPDTTQVAAAESDSFPAWVEKCRENPGTRSLLSNAQTRSLSAVYGRSAVVRRTAQGGFDLDVDQALRNLDQVEMLARTECFNDDVAKFPAIAARHGIAFEYSGGDPVNATSTDLSLPLEQRLENFRAQIGSACYDELIALNSQDLTLYEYASDRLSGRTAAKQSRPNQLT